MSSFGFRFHDFDTQKILLNVIVATWRPLISVTVPLPFSTSSSNWFPATNQTAVWNKQRFFQRALFGINGAFFNGRCPGLGVSDSRWPRSQTTPEAMVWESSMPFRIHTLSNQARKDRFLWVSECHLKRSYKVGLVGLEKNMEIFLPHKFPL